MRSSTVCSRAARAFFALAGRDQERMAIERSPHYLGYARMALEWLDPARPGDAKESFNWDPNARWTTRMLLAGVPFVGPNQWPRVPGFRAAMLAYFDRVRDPRQRSIARSPSISASLPTYFERIYDRPLSALRVLRYPPHPERSTARNTARYRTPITAASRCSRKTSARARGAYAATANGSRSIRARRIRVQHRRCAHALDQRHLRVQCAPRRQPLGPRNAFSVAFFCEPNPGRRDRMHPGLQLRNGRRNMRRSPFADVPAFALEPTYAASRARALEARLERGERASSCH